MSIGYIVLRLEGGQINIPLGVTGSRNSQDGIGLRHVDQSIFMFPQPF